MHSPRTRSSSASTSCFSFTLSGASMWPRGESFDVDEEEAQITQYEPRLALAKVGDISLFRMGDQPTSYAGLTPSTHSRGGVTHHGQITKEGSRWLRWAMVEAAHVHFRFDTPVTRAYRRIAERRGKSKAKVVAARMLLLVCRSVLKNRRPYFNLVYGQA